MKLKLKATPDQIELIKAIGSKDLVESRKAQEMLAGFIGPVVQKVIMQAGTVPVIYTDSPYNEDDDPSLPLDLFYDQNNVTYVQTWSQSVAGGLPTSQIEGVAELKITTYRLDSAVSFSKKYARRSRLDVISKAVERMSQELLIKQERNGWAVILRAVAEATTVTIPGQAASTHVLGATTENVFQVNDLSKWMTLIRRLNVSWAGGTPSPLDNFGLTDIYVSPEIKEQIRAFAFNPMNTTAGVLSGTSSAGYTASFVPLPDAVREEIYRAAGTSEIFGVSITDLNELGVNAKYNTLFAAYAKAGMGKHASTFATADDEVLIGFDLTKDALIRPIAQNADNGATVVTQADDQWSLRSDKAGFYTALEEGRICIEGRALTALVV